MCRRWGSEGNTDFLGSFGVIANYRNGIKAASDVEASDANINPLSRSESMSDETVNGSAPTVNIKPIPGFEGYFASDAGDIFSQWKKKGLGTGRGTTYVLGGEMRRLCTSTNRRGYIQVKMSTNGKQYTRRVNRLILQVFAGNCPPEHEACHENGDRADNRLKNLRWDTPKANQADRVKHGTSNRGERHPHSRLTESSVLEIRRRISEKESARAVAKTHGVTADYVRAIGRRAAWGWL